MEDITFSDIAIVACGTLSLELNHLKKEGLLDTDHILYTAPGLHENICELERQLLEQIERAQKRADKVIVVYGGRFCYLNADLPTRTILSGLVEPVGAAIGFLILLPFLSNDLLAGLLAFVSGIMVYISVDELLPMAHRYGHSHIVISGIVLGMFIMALSLLIL